MDHQCSTTLVPLCESARRASTSRCLAQDSVGVHGNMSKLYDELLADISALSRVLCPSLPPSYPLSRFLLPSLSHFGYSRLSDPLACISWIESRSQSKQLI